MTSTSEVTDVRHLHFDQLAHLLGPFFVHCFRVVVGAGVAVPCLDGRRVRLVRVDAVLLDRLTDLGRRHHALVGQRPQRESTT